jgi:thioesterase domain-containing protein
MRNPSAFNIGIQKIVKMYIAAVKRLQPKGPYLLGGWSAGGVLAYEMSRQLVQEGERVNKLILIDSPYPINLEPLPASFHAFCGKIGLLGREGGKDLPKWLLPHFAASVRELTSYSELLGQVQIDVKDMPETTTIWAQKGIVQDTGPKPDWDSNLRMPNSMKWLCENRKDLGHNGWDALVGPDKVKCVSVRGNHFTMMREPLVS